MTARRPIDAGPATRGKEIHLILIWSNARSHADRIMADIGSQFVVREVVSLAWTPERFSENLTRFYGTHLPPQSEKERHCGTAPFLVIVVEDSRPVYRRRWTNRGWATVNTALFRAKLRYRRWAGSAYGVHTSDTREEAARDVFFLLGRRPSLYTEYTDDRGLWDGTIEERSADLTGADGWATFDELLEAIRLVTPCSVSAGLAEDTVDLVVDDVWWAEVIANGRRVGGDRSISVVSVAGRDVVLRLHASGRRVREPSRMVRWIRPLVGGFRAASQCFRGGR
jgi:hypothetical protein